jgi:hypothetical protein
MFRANISSPFQGRKLGDLFSVYFVPASCLACSSTLKVEVIRSSETSVAFQGTEIEFMGVHLDISILAFQGLRN